MEEFILSKVAGQKPASLQNGRSIAGIFEEFCLKFSKHLFFRTNFSGYLLKSYYIYHCLTEVLQDFEIHLNLPLLRQTLKVVKINYHAPMQSETKLKKREVRNWVNIDIFLNKILDSRQVSQKFRNTVSFHLLKLAAFKTSGLKILTICFKHFVNVPVFKTSGCICTKVSLRNSNNLQYSFAVR